MRLLPHRYPFLLVDRIIEIDGDNFVCVDLRDDLDAVAVGHDRGLVARFEFHITPALQIHAKLFRRFKIGFGRVGKFRWFGLGIRRGLAPAARSCLVPGGLVLTTGLRVIRGESFGLGPGLHDLLDCGKQSFAV
jgi:hypothetical protein